MAFCLASCGNQHEVSFKSGGVTQTFSEGKGAVLKEFETLVYPGAITTGSVSAEGESEEQSKFLMLSSTDSVQAISQWYQEALKKQNWKMDRVQDMLKLISLSGHKDNLEINVMIADDGGKTTISLSAGKQADGMNEEKQPIQNYTPNQANPPTD